MKLRLKISMSLLIIAVGALTLFNCSLSDHNFSPQRANTSLINSSSGVQGQVLLGPVHGGPPAAGDNAYIGFAALFYVKNDKGEVVTKFNSDSNGWFRVDIGPGNYVIVPDSSAPLIDPEQQSQQVTIVKGNFSNVVLHFDSPS